MRKLLFLILLFPSLCTLAAPRIRYELDFSRAYANYIGVTLEIDQVKGSYADVKMPVWAPGSYLVREFARHVDQVTTNGSSVEKIDKNTWRVYKGNAATLKVMYQVYAFELSVRTSFADASHAYINGTSVFMYVAGRKNEPCEVKLKGNPAWQTLSVALPATKEGLDYIITAPDYDELADAPMEYGNQLVWSFTASGVPHEIALYGDGSYPEKKEQVIRDLTRIVEEATKVFGEHPSKRYIFIVHNLDQGGGGLEHLNSTTCQVSRWNWSTEAGYRGIMSLFAHEYFHLWNVKRLRPEALGPFDYDKENYTHNLWVAEGFTAYYDELLLRRAGIISAKQYLNMVTSNLNGVVNTPGDKVQSLSESSFDAWIKLYRPNENSRNVTISYYGKGAVAANMLDLLIMERSQGKRNLDDVLRSMYQEYYIKKKRGYSDAELKAACEKIAGTNLTGFFDSLVYKPLPFNYAAYFAKAGFILSDTSQADRNSKASLGVNTSNTNGRLQVTYVEAGGGAEKSGINVNDELIAVNGFRLNNDLNSFVDRARPGDIFELMIGRGGRVMTRRVALQPRSDINYTLRNDPAAGTAQLEVKKAWLRD